jgi:hypothetical protein
MFSSPDQNLGAMGDWFPVNICPWSCISDLPSGLNWSVNWFCLKCVIKAQVSFKFENSLQEYDTKSYVK